MKSSRVTNLPYVDVDTRSCVLLYLIFTKDGGY